MKKIFIVLVIMGLVATCGATYFFYNFISQPNSTEDKKLIFIVQPGAFGLIAHQLAQVGVIRDARLFSLYGRLIGKAGAIKVGEYELNTNMRPPEVLAVITSGKSIEYPFVFQEGLNMYDVANLLESRGFAKREEFLSLCKNKAFIRELLGEDLPSLEGYLFPNTYLFTKFTGVKEIIREMIRQFLSAYSEIDADAKEASMTRHQVVILASIIEKETGAPEERPRVSSVFHNRLKKGMMLQTDPTVTYGILDATGVMPINIHKSDLLNPSRYNTYTFKGLPFGPISNPGKESLKAAVEPEETEFLFFVSRNDGTHTFTGSYEDHSRAVSKFQLDRKQREGKSWRDLSKKRRPKNQ